MTKTEEIGKNNEYRNKANTRKRNGKSLYKSLLLAVSFVIIMIPTRAYGETKTTSSLVEVMTYNTTTIEKWIRSQSQGEVVQPVFRLVLIVKNRPTNKSFDAGNASTTIAHYDQWHTLFVNHTIDQSNENILDVKLDGKVIEFKKSTERQFYSTAYEFEKIVFLANGCIDITDSLKPDICAISKTMPFGTTKGAACTEMTIQQFLGSLGQLHGFPVVVVSIFATLCIIVLTLSIVLCKRQCCKGNQAIRDDSFMLQYHVSQNNSLNRISPSMNMQTRRLNQVQGNYGNTMEERVPLCMSPQLNRQVSQTHPYNQSTPYMGVRKFSDRQNLGNGMEETIQPGFPQSINQLSQNNVYGLSSPRMDANRQAQLHNNDETDTADYFYQQQKLGSLNNFYGVPSRYMDSRRHVQRQGSLNHNIREPISNHSTPYVSANRKNYENPDNFMPLPDHRLQSPLYSQSPSCEGAHARHQGQNSQCSNWEAGQHKIASVPSTPSMSTNRPHQKQNWICSNTGVMASPLMNAKRVHQRQNSINYNKDAASTSENQVSLDNLKGQPTPQMVAKSSNLNYESHNMHDKVLQEKFTPSTTQVTQNDTLFSAPDL